jgi:hypothetical protein
VHPTTVGYGIIAQEFIDVMQSAGVAFYYGDETTAGRIASRWISRDCSRSTR